MQIQLNRHRSLPLVQLSHHNQYPKDAKTMSDNIIRLNKTLIKDNLKDLVRNSVAQYTFPAMYFLSSHAERYGGKQDAQGYPRPGKQECCSYKSTGCGEAASGNEVHCCRKKDRNRD